MAGSFENDDYYIKTFDGTNFTIWKQHMMDVLVNKGLTAPLKDRRKGAYNDDQWEELDARARAMIWLHLGESIFFTIMDKTIAFKLWDSLSSTWDGKSASNKVSLMKKLMRLSMKEGSSVSSHLNDFNALYLQLTSKGLNFDDEMKAIFLLCSLPTSWDTFNTAISNSTHGGKLAFGDVTSVLLTEEIRRQSLDSGVHGHVTIHAVKTLHLQETERKVENGLFKHGDVEVQCKLDRVQKMLTEEGGSQEQLMNQRSQEDCQLSPNFTLKGLVYLQEENKSYPKEELAIKKKGMQVEVSQRSHQYQIPTHIPTLDIKLEEVEIQGKIKLQCTKGEDMKIDEDIMCFDDENDMMKQFYVS
ncbi:hypothetical protein L7F22_055507 [Adiantum nelumboides]|nr:hypothetical protein [Adiantum nelumboides]